MKPTVVLVGRPNVGKSTLFNKLTRTRDAIVADFPGLTRDRHYGLGKVGDKPFIVVDTGGFEPVASEGIVSDMARQTEQAIDESDVVLFIVDARQGLTAQDKIIADKLRRAERPVWVAVNKAEGIDEALAEAEFFELGLGNPVAISAAHGENVPEMIERALAAFEVDTEKPEKSDHPKIAIVGRPNVGKSTLVNRFLGEERVLAFDEPGTTRDSIYIDFEHRGRQYTVIDTAGVRRRGKVSLAIEKFSVIKTLQAIEDANVVVLVLDATQDISDQDAHIGSFIAENGRSVVLAINKWDSVDSAVRDRTKNELARKLRFLSHAATHYISALKGTQVEPLFGAINEAYAAAMARLPTPKLTRLLIAATAEHSPPQEGPHRPKLRYAHQGGMNPPLVIIHGTGIERIPESYRRFLEKRFRDAFKLTGTPLRIEFRQGANPFANRKPKPLTEGEENRARRQRKWGRKKYG